MKRKIAAMIVAIGLFAVPVGAFQTWGTFDWMGTLGSDPIHDYISEVLMRECGFNDDAYDWTIEWMAEQDEVLSAEVEDPLNHFDNQRIQDAANELFTRIDDLIGPAYAGKILQDEGRLDEVYHKLGEILHAAHDFYAHSTHVEYVLSQFDAHTLPGWNSITSISSLPLVEWPDYGRLNYKKIMKDNNLSFQIDSMPHIKSGYYLTSEMVMDAMDNLLADIRQEFPNANMKTTDEYCTFFDCAGRYRDDPEVYLSYQKAIENATSPNDEMHLYLNKDANSSTMGRIAQPFFNKTLHEIAYNMAERETVRLWKTIEIGILKIYPKTGPCIVRAIQQAEIPDDCQNLPVEDDIATKELPVKDEGGTPRDILGDTGIPPGSEGEMTLNFETAEEAEGDFNFPKQFQASFAGQRKVQGVVRLKVDWRTGEIVGVGRAVLMIPAHWTIQGYVEGIKKIDGTVQSGMKGREVPVYVSGWLEDGAKEIRMVRVYSTEKDVMSGTVVVDGVAQTGSGEPERVIDDGYGKVPLDGTPVLNDPGNIEAGPAKLRLRDKAWVRLKSPIPPGLPLKYKQTRFGDGGPLAKKVGLPPVESIEGMVQEFRQELPGVQKELAEMRAEMESEPVDPEDAEMAAMQKKILAQAQGALAGANQKIDEFEDKDQ